MNVTRIIRALALPAAALAVIALAGCGTSAHHAAGPKLSPACATAFQVARYVSGKTTPTNGADDLAEQSMLSGAHWQTRAERRLAAMAGNALGKAWAAAPADGIATGFPPALDGDIQALLLECSVTR